MKVLILGAGGVGGYFGGRLLEKGVDVTFLVREKRMLHLQKNGLVINSIHGNIKKHVTTIRSGMTHAPFDIIILTNKAYHLAQALDDIEPFVGKNTVIIPLLNGIKHLQIIVDRYGEEKVMGGLCFIETTLDQEGNIIQTSQVHDMVFGERNGERTKRAEQIAELFKMKSTTFRLSKNIMQDMWHKYMFITVLSGITTLMRSSIGPIQHDDYGKRLIRELFTEVEEIMLRVGAPIAEGMIDKYMVVMNKQDDTMKSSMLRDIEKGGEIEGDHLQGYLVSLADQYGIQAPLLRIVYKHLQVYEHNLNK
ncbi:ketopantoate reductase family protein [Bacillus alkalicellulosilyticus]|uniref:ketopantoate reductase family protein n=1 Tax=Alkalihalobacterium alkalicellulosilyticum TaxID=1912214 RepID=UPI0009974951|nr:ketopantoate reductase family protein [Bacillus alkalicellulosilyticus]